MSIPQPTLDDRSYAGLLDEALTLIPSLAPDWTNHNPSDPGITLVELFAWLTEMLIYRVNRLPDENSVAFLRLLNGPQWIPSGNLEEDVRTTVTDLRRRHRAVTSQDYEALAREASPGVARARCVPKRNLAAASDADRRAVREGYVSVVVVPDLSDPGAVDPGSQPGAPLPASRVLTEVRHHLGPRRMMTVRQLVVPPTYVPIQARILIATRPEVAVGPLRGRVKEAVERYLDALTGGPEGTGWPFGRDVYVSEIYRLLERVPGVEHVPDVVLSSSDAAGPRSVAGTELWHQDGDQIGIGLEPHHLPWARIDPAQILIGSAFLQARIHVEAHPAAGVDPAAARRAAKDKVKSLLHWPAGAPTDLEVSTATIEAALVSLPQIADTPLPIVTIQADAARLSVSGTVTRVSFKAKERADLTVTADI